jgi:hypothetical protein
MIQKIEAVLTLVTLFGLLLGGLANVLPAGKLKTFASYAGIRMIKGAQEARGALPKPPAEDPKP